MLNLITSHTIPTFFNPYNRTSFIGFHFMGISFGTLSGAHVPLWKTKNDWGMVECPNMHLFFERELEPRDHQLVSVHFLWMRPVLKFRCLQLGLLRCKCHPLFPWKLHKYVLMHMMSMLSSLRNLDKAPMTLHYRLCMQTTLLNTCGTER